MGVGTRGGTGAGVGESRVEASAAGGGASSTGFSAAAAGSVNDWLACKAVVLIALNNNMLFCRFLPSPGVAILRAPACTSVSSGSCSSVSICAAMTAVTTCMDEFQGSSRTGNKSFIRTWSQCR